jgi:tetrahydromethanopterin S-methyltransferase subunit G
MALSDWRALRGRVDELEKRVLELEADLAQERRLQRRVAELTDIVAALLLPADQRDDDDVQARLEDYAQGV